MKKFITLSSLVLCAISLSAQQVPPTCPAGVGPSSDLCSEVCLSCGLNGYLGTTFGYTGQTPPGFCGTVENEQWFAFVAAVPAATFTATPNNCTDGNGIQIALYTSCTSSPIACEMGGSGYASIPVSATAVLVPGEVYYLMVDGYAGDQCDFTLTVAPPFAVSTLPVDSTGVIHGPDSLCSVFADTIFVEPVDNAAFYTWTAPPGVLINGMQPPLNLPASYGNQVVLQLNEPIAEVCVQAGNPCSDAPNISCKTFVQKASAPPVDLPSVTICFEEVFYQLPWDGQVSQPGIYEHAYSCDSVVRLEFNKLPQIITDLPPIVLCSGDVVEVCGQTFHSNGNYSVVCTSEMGCDSTVNFEVIVLDPQAQINVTQRGLTCSLSDLILNGSASPGTNIWLNYSGDTLGTGSTLPVTEPGFYFLQKTLMSNGVSCSANAKILIKQLQEPPPVTAVGGTLSIQSPWVVLRAKCLFSNVSFSWTGPNGFSSNQQNPIVSVPGMYTVTVMDLGTGCTNSATAEVIQE